MKTLRRYDRRGDIVFTAHIIYDRRPILMNHGEILLEALERTSMELNVSVLAYAILPDHFHILTHSETTGVSEFFRLVKSRFSGMYRSIHNLKSGKLWQNRYWDHIIRNEDDLLRHIDYIHFNPVKHGLVTSPFDWQYSSIHDDRYVGAYASYWGSVEEPKLEGEFGE